MKQRQLTLIIILIALSWLIFQNCTTKKNEKKTITYINSFHRGHPSSDDIMDGIIEHLPPKNYDVSYYFMDTKRKSSIRHIQKIAAHLLDTIKRNNPDILLISDDNAIKYIVQPNLKELDMPIVFCGINWTDKEYNLPPDHVTGMLEILPVSDMILTVKSLYPDISNLLFLSENTTTSRKEKQLLDTLFNRAGVVASYKLVADFEEWKIAFKDANNKIDMIYLPTNGAITGWDHDEAIRFIGEHIQVPVVTTEDFMMPYAVFGLTKVAKEQGIWVAETAKKILAGGQVKDFSVTKNQQRKYLINAGLATKIGFEPDSALFTKSIMLND